MIRALILRGLATGLAAGLLAGAFALVLGEPLIDEAISFETHTHAHQHAGDVSRDIQRTGLLVATGLYGCAAGGLFALAFAALRGRVRTRDDGRLALTLAVVLFVATIAVPFLKYPANPPGVGAPNTISERTLLFTTMVVTSLLAMVAAWRTGRAVPAQLPAWTRAATAGVVFAAVAGVAAALLPAGDPVPAAFPADLLWEFRVVSLATQLVLWSALGLLFALACSRSAAAHPGPWRY